jgi:hypothetical protein
VFVRATLAAIILCAACGNAQTIDAGTDASCTGVPLTCCNSCLDDVHKPAVCDDGEWRCPSGAVSQLDCIGQCTGTSGFCEYLPMAHCASCADGTTSEQYCNAGKLVCPSGSYDTVVDDAGACLADA